MGGTYQPQPTGHGEGGERRQGTEEERPQEEHDGGTYALDPAEGGREAGHCGRGVKLDSTIPPRIPASQYGPFHATRPRRLLRQSVRLADGIVSQQTMTRPRP